MNNTLAALDRILNYLELRKSSTAELRRHAEADRAELQALRDALAGGARVVPVEADSKMIDAGVAMALQVSVHGEGGWSKYIAALYRQLLAAAPSMLPNGGEGE